MVDKKGTIKEAAGIKTADPDSLVGKKVWDNVPYPAKVAILRHLIARVHKTNTPATMTIPIHTGTEVLMFRVHVKPHISGNLVLTAEKLD